MDSPSIEQPAATLLNFFEPGINKLTPEEGDRAEADSQVIALVPAGQLPEGESEEEKESAEDEETDGATEWSICIPPMKQPLPMAARRRKSGEVCVWS